MAGSLGELRVPGTGVARLVIQTIKAARRSAELRRQLAEVLQNAEAEFTQQARRQGLTSAAEWVAQLPIQNLPTLRQALDILLKQWDEQRLQEVLEGELDAIPDFDAQDRRQAVALYLAILRQHLLAHEQFRAVIPALSILRVEQGVTPILETLTHLYDALTPPRLARKTAPLASRTPTNRFPPDPLAAPSQIPPGPLPRTGLPADP